jgi:hypothetical protein
MNILGGQYSIALALTISCKVAAVYVAGAPVASRRILHRILSSDGHSYMQIAIDMKDQVAFSKRSL